MTTKAEPIAPGRLDASELQCSVAVNDSSLRWLEIDT
jgi:hypothetical protein